MLFGEERTLAAPSDISFEIPMTVSVSQRTLSITLSVARIMCMFSLRCSLIPGSLSITFPSPDLSFIEKSIIDCILSYMLLVRTAIFEILLLFLPMIFSYDKHWNKILMKIILSFIKEFIVMCTVFTSIFLFPPALIESFDPYDTV